MKEYERTTQYEYKISIESFDDEFRFYYYDEAGMKQEPFRGDVLHLSDLMVKIISGGFAPPQERDDIEKELEKANLF